MRFRIHFPLFTLTAGITGLLILVAGTAAAQQKNNQNNAQAQAKKAAANAVSKANAEAKAAQTNAQQAQKAVMDLNGAITAARQAVAEATKAQKTLEDGIVDAQPSNSDFAKVRDQYRAAEKAYQDAQKSVKESDDYRAKHEAAQSSEDPEALVALQQEFNALPEIAGPRTAFQDIQQTYEPLLAKLLAADPKWGDANKDLLDKEQTLANLNRQFTEASVLARKAKAAAQKAAALAAAAAAAQQQANNTPNQKNKKGSGQY